MGIKQKLEKLWCNKVIEGKTIFKVYHGTYSPIISFTDGTYFCRENPLQLMETYKFDKDICASDHPLVIIGILKIYEVNKYWEERKKQKEIILKENRRQQYDQLKKEFENEL